MLLTYVQDTIIEKASPNALGDRLFCKWQIPSWMVRPPMEGWTVSSQEHQEFQDAGRWEGEVEA